MSKSDLDFSALENATDNSTTMVSIDTSHSRSDYTEEELAGQERSVYEKPDGSDSADNVDPRLLFDTPTQDEVRWYYNYTMGNTIVEKPIEDAHKHGFDVVDDVSDDVREFLDEYIPYNKDAEIKSRRDGPSAIFFQFNDDNAVYEPPGNVTDLNGFQLFTLDKWADDIDYEKVKQGTDIEDEEHIYVRDTGLVIRDDLSHPDHEELLGYAVKKKGGKETQFVHADRCQHFVWNHNVDGSVDEYTVGQHEGNSVLLSVLIPLKALTMANWALGKTIYRYSAPLYAITAPESGVSDDDFDKVDGQIENLNSASDVTLPPGWDIKTEGTEGDLNPEPYIDKLIEQICAGVEMTKSVLMGTQTGTVSGSSTDIKNYFNGVERYRNNRALEKIDEAVQMVNGYSSNIISDAAANSYSIDWGPLFKMDNLDKAEAMVRVITAASNGINSYVLTPEEAREIVQMQWATLEIDTDLGDLSEADMEILKEINAGQGNDIDESGNPAVGQNGGGNEGTQDPNDPT